MRLAALSLLFLAAAAISACTPFAAVGSGSAAASFGTRLGQGTSLGGWTVTPLRVLEDSRCPGDVMCVQAGTARLLVRVQRGGKATDVSVGLDRPVNIGGAWLHLAALCPYPLASRPVAAADYRMHFVLGDAQQRPAAPIACAAA